MFLLDCSSYSTLSVVYVIKNIISIICVLVPVFLAILIIKKIAVTVIGGEDFDFKIIKSILIKAFGAVLIVLFPSLLGGINFIINGTSSTDGFCWSQATLSNVSSAKKEYLSSDKNLSEYEKYKQKREEEKKKKEEELKEKEKNNKDKVNVIDPSLIVGVGDSSSGNAIQSGSNHKLLLGAKIAQNYTQTNGYEYGDARSFDGKDLLGVSATSLNAKVVSCDRGVALALYYAGYLPKDADVSHYGLLNLISFFEQNGATFVANFGDLQPGDVVFYDKQHDGEVSVSQDNMDHVLIWDTPTHKYDWGSNAQIKDPENMNSGPAVANSANAYWYGAYRLPG